MRRLHDFIDATNRATRTAFVAAFTKDAYLNDWGREFHGHDSEYAWNRTDNISISSATSTSSRAEPGPTPTATSSP